MAEALRALITLLRLAPVITLALFLIPIGAGLVGTLLPAFDVLPALGYTEPSLAPWRELLTTPGFGHSVRLTLTVGFGATLLSFFLALGFCAIVSDHPLWQRFEHGLAPMLATPHVAVAIGFAFLIGSSGWIARVLSPEITGWDRPPDISTLRDSYGLSFMLGLVIKEVPYLVLMTLSASGQIPARPMTAAARSMGYDGPTAWLKVVFPQIYRQIRLPVFAVLAFSLSVVEVGLILAPGHPPPLSIMAARLFASYDLALHRPGAAAAILQLVLVALGILLWWTMELIVGAFGRRWIERGERRGAAAPLLGIAGWGALTAGFLSVVSIASLALWSVARDWRYPDALPQGWTLANWSRASATGAPVVTTLVIGMAASALAVILTLGCLENEERRGIRPGINVLWLLYLPLLIPQIAFLFGVQVLLVRLDLDTTLAGVVWAHLLFVLPYVFLSLADPYRALDPRYAQIAAGLGISPFRAFARIKIPILLRPILIAFAVGFAVSVGQYLPTLFAGGGRVATLTTEAVTLAGGADRRLIGVTAFLQAGLPFLVYVLALAVPSVLFFNRRGLR